MNFLIIFFCLTALLLSCLAGIATVPSNNWSPFSSAYFPMQTFLQGDGWQSLKHVWEEICLAPLADKREAAVAISPRSWGGVGGEGEEVLLCFSIYFTMSISIILTIEDSWIITLCLFRYSCAGRVKNTSPYLSHSVLSIFGCSYSGYLRFRYEEYEAQEG